MIKEIQNEKTDCFINVNDIAAVIRMQSGSPAASVYKEDVEPVEQIPVILGEHREHGLIGGVRALHPARGNTHRYKRCPQDRYHNEQHEAQVYGNTSSLLQAGPLQKSVRCCSPGSSLYPVCSSPDSSAAS